MHGDSPKLNRSLGKALELLDLLAAKRSGCVPPMNGNLPKLSLLCNLVAAAISRHPAIQAATMPVNNRRYSFRLSRCKCAFGLRDQCAHLVVAIRAPFEAPGNRQ